MSLTVEEADRLGPAMARRAWALEAANRLVSDWTSQVKNERGYVHDKWQPIDLATRTTSVIQLAEYLLVQDPETTPGVSPANLVAPAVPTPHLHRASCHGPAGELTCGYPPGPGI